MAQTLTAYSVDGKFLTVYQIVKLMGVKNTPKGINILGLASAKAFANALVAEAEALALEAEGQIEQAIAKSETAFDLLEQAVAKA